MKPAAQPAIRLSGPTPGSVGELGALTDEELANRRTVLLDSLQRIIDEEERRRLKPRRYGKPEIVWQHGRPIVIDRGRH